MFNELEPIAGNWYICCDKGPTFRVLDCDTRQRRIDIQYFDGTIEEIEFEDWAMMDLELGAEPEDWTGPVDDIAKDDLGYSETSMRGMDWNESTSDFHDMPEAWEIDADATPVDHVNL